VQGAVQVDAGEAQIAAGLAADGLVALEGGWLRPPTE
jgi:hypothetical protein